MATLGVLRAASRRGPVLAVVDDLQWIDASSRECIEYAARRAGGPLTVVLAARDPWCPSEHVHLPELRIGPVDDAGAAELLRQRAPDLAPPVAAAIGQAAAGNPLALVELTAMLNADQRTGAAPLDLPLAPGRRLQRAFSGRVGALDEQARRALLIAAAHAGPELPVIAAACLGAGTDVGHLREAEASGLVRVDTNRVSFTHPLIRGVVYQEAEAAERRIAHAALAAALGDDDDRRAWHLAAAAVGTDEEVAAGLERVGGRAVARRAYAAGSRALDRAARLTPARETASRRLIAAGRAAGGAGMADRALALFGEAAEIADGEELQARAQQLRGQVMLWRGQGAEALPLLAGQAGLVAPRLPALAAAMYSDAANCATTTGSYLEAERLAWRAAGLLPADADPALRGAVLGMLGWALLLRGKASQARLVLGEAARLAAGDDPLGPDWLSLHLVLRCQIPLGEFERARAESLELCRRAREAGALAAVGGTLLVAADTAFRLGDWDAADAAALEGLQATGEVGQPAIAGWLLTIRVRILAAQGRHEEGRAVAQAALQIAESARIASGLRYVHAALGFLELGLDRTGAAISELETVERLIEGTGLEEPVIVPWEQDLVEAYARQGRAGDARRVLARLEHLADRTGSPVAQAAAARCRGMVDDDFEPGLHRRARARRPAADAVRAGPDAARLRAPAASRPAARRGPRSSHPGAVRLRAVARCRLGRAGRGRTARGRGPPPGA